MARGAARWEQRLRMCLPWLWFPVGARQGVSIFSYGQS